MSLQFLKAKLCDWKTRVRNEEWTDKNLRICVLTALCSFPKNGKLEITKDTQCVTYVKKLEKLLPLIKYSRQKSVFFLIYSLLIHFI